MGQARQQNSNRYIKCQQCLDSLREKHALSLSKPIC